MRLSVQFRRWGILFSLPVLVVAGIMLVHREQRVRNESRSAACSEIFLNKGGGAFVSARNFDYMAGPGYVRYHAPGRLRRAQYVPEGSRRLAWKSKYASVVFDKVLDASAPGDGRYSAGVDGINSAGLKIGTYMLQESSFPAGDGRPLVDTATLMQYLLDNYASVGKAIAALRGDTFRVAPTLVDGASGWPLGLHYFLHDAGNASAIVEFLSSGTNIVENPEVPVLTNDTYATSLAYLSTFSFDDSDAPARIPGSWSSLDRFVRGAYYLSRLPVPANARDAVALGFSAIQSPAIPEMSFDGIRYGTQWTIVTDIRSRVAYFRTVGNPAISAVHLQRLSRLKQHRTSCKIDLRRTDLTGDITSELRSACRNP